MKIITKTKIDFAKHVSTDNQHKAVLGLESICEINEPAFIQSHIKFVCKAHNVVWVTVPFFINIKPIAELLKHES